jgi:hypothetical protein
MELVLTERSYAEVVGNLLALRALAVELESAFASYDPRGGHSASVGAHAMVETVDRILDALGHAGDRTVG